MRKEERAFLKKKRGKKLLSTRAQPMKPALPQTHKSFLVLRVPMTERQRGLNRAAQQSFKKELLVL